MNLQPPARGVVGLVTAAWVVLANLVGLMFFEGEHCTVDYEDPQPLSAGAELMCSHSADYPLLFWVFLITGFATVAVLVKAWEPTWRRTLRLCLGAALTPFAVYAVLRAVVAVG